MRNVMEANCKICGKRFIKKAFGQITCSKECQRENHKRNQRLCRQKAKIEQEKANRKTGLTEVIRLVNIYNSAHKESPISYGKMSLMLESGQTCKEEIERML